MCKMFEEYYNKQLLRRYRMTVSNCIENPLDALTQHECYRVTFERIALLSKVAVAIGQWQETLEIALPPDVVLVDADYLWKAFKSCSRDPAGPKLLDQHVRFLSHSIRVLRNATSRAK
jgi:hypothetical protein